MAELEAEGSNAGLAAGTQMGPYRLLDVLGRGGTAIVFRAIHEPSGRFVALKTVRAVREGLLASVRREIQTVGHLRHPGIVRIFDGGVSDGRPWYAMDLLEGRTLRAHLRASSFAPVSMTTEQTAPPIDDAAASLISAAGGELPFASLPSQVPSPARPRPATFGGETSWFLGVIRALCQPLAYLHGEGFVHRDLKPSNVFVRHDGTVVVMDFGLVWLLQEEGGREVLSVDAARDGTYAYMAPEQALGERMDARGDLFALGCILYEAITGRPAFPVRDRDELVKAHAQSIPAPSRVADGVPPALDALVLGLLERNPRDRIGHASDVAAVLADLDTAAPLTVDAPLAKSYLYRPDVVGRGAQLDTALDHVANLQQRGGGMVLISGESGIGKTSLVAEVARRAGAQGVRVVTSECVAVGVSAGRGLRQGGPLYPFARLLQAIADRCLADGVECTARLLGERAKVLATTEPSLRDLPGIRAYPEPAEVPAEAAHRRLIDAMAETLSAFAKDRPVLVVLDDLQWADDVTFAFLASLSERYFADTALMVLGTYRSEESTPDLERLASIPHVTSVGLDRLDAAAIGAMSAGMLGQRKVPEQLAAFLTAESSGNPFFVAEYLRAAVDAALLFRDERGRWQQTTGALALDTLGFPRNLHALVTRRLRGLSEPALRLTEIAAVLGREVDIASLATLARDSDVAPDEPSFEALLRSLMVRQVLEATSPGSVRFVHDKLREVAYDDLSADRLVALHRAAGTLLERLYLKRGVIERNAASLAHHFERAGDLAKAMAYFDQGGEAAHQMHANQEAFRLLTRARALQQEAQLPSSALARAQRERLLGLDALALGNVQEALARLTEATRFAGQPWPPTRVALAGRCLLAFGSELLRRWAPWLLPQGSQPEQDRELLLEAARAYERLSVVTYYATGELLAVVCGSAVTLDLTQRAGGATAELALGYATFAVTCSLVPLDKMARSYATRATDVARQSGDAVAESWVLVNAGAVHLVAGRWQATRECLETVRSIARKVGFSRRWEEATAALSTTRLLHGRLAEAEQLSDELAGSVERAYPQSRCWAVVRQAELALLRGDADAALEAAREGERLCQQGLGFAEWIYTLGPLALAHLRRGDLEAAREAADRCAEWAAKGSAPIFYNIWSLAAMVEVYVSLWDFERDPTRRRALKEAGLRAVKRLELAGKAMAIASPRAALWRGLALAKLEGNPKAAARQLREAEKRARVLDMPYDRASALAALAEHTTDPTERAELLRQAAAGFRETRAAHDLARVERMQSAPAGAAA